MQLARLFIIGAFFLLAGKESVAQQIPSWKITDVQHYLNSTDGVVVVNFWATFCKPCVAEIPGFIKTTSDYKEKGAKLLLVSLDLPSYYPSRIASFARQHNFTVPIAWLQETNADYFCPAIDSSWSGSIPATLIINRKTGYRKFFEGEMTQVEFDSAMKQAVSSK